MKLYEEYSTTLFLMLMIRYGLMNRSFGKQNKNFVAYYSNMPMQMKF